MLRGHKKCLFMKSALFNNRWRGNKALMLYSDCFIVSQSDRDRLKRSHMHHQGTSVETDLRSDLKESSHPKERVAT